MINQHHNKLSALTRTLNESILYYDKNYKPIQKHYHQNQLTKLQ